MELSHYCHHPSPVLILFFYCLFFLSSADSDLKLQLTYGPTKERPVPTTLVGLIHIQYNTAGSRNPANDLVETTSPGHHSSSAPSGLVETTSPRPRHTPELAKALLRSYCFSHRPVKVIPPCHQLRLGLKEELSPSHRVAATRCSITRSHSHAQLILISYYKWDLSLQQQI